MAWLRPGQDSTSLTAIGVMAVALALVSASQDIVVDAYRTDLLPEPERGAGAAATNPAVSYCGAASAASFVALKAGAASSAAVSPALAPIGGSAGRAGAAL